MEDEEEIVNVATHKSYEKPLAEHNCVIQTTKY